MPEYSSFSPAKPRRSLFIGKVQIGGGAPVSVQSMTNTDTRNIESTLKQIFDLAKAGCEVIRLAVPDEKAAIALKTICLQSPLPVVADIHFDARLAVLSLEAGAAALRINPGNIGGEAKVDLVASAAKSNGASIRIGVNAGSLSKEILHKYHGPTPEALVESALAHTAMLEKRHFENIKISLKSSSVQTTLAAYRLMAKHCDYPLHVGITEAGTLLRGAVKSSVGIGILLAEGLGDTIRVSLTHDPIQEVRVAWHILRSLGLRQRGVEVISCPTCGRTEINLIQLAENIEQKLQHVEENFTVAVMGCVVNGPGEAKEADIGIAGGRGKGILFRKGQVVGSVTGGLQELEAALLAEINKFLEEKINKTP